LTVNYLRLFSYAQVQKIELTSDHVIEQLFIRVPAFELSLPTMMMGVDKTGADQLVGTVDDLGILRGLNVVRNRHNFAILNQKAGNGWRYVIIIVM
jgi:hypothetical protein